MLSIFSAGSLFAQDSASDEPSGGETQTSTERLDFYPLDLAVDSEGTTYVADLNLHGVWRWKGGEISKFFEGESKYRTPLYAPRCVAVDGEGHVYVGDSATREIYKVEAGEAKPLTNGAIGIPIDMAFMPDGSIVVADLELRRLVLVPAGGGAPKTIAENNPRGVCVDDNGLIWVVSQDPQQLQTVKLDGEVQVVVKSRIFQFPHQVAVDSEGTAYITDGYKAAIWRVRDGGEPEVWAEGAPLVNPVGITIVGESVRVVDPRARKVVDFDQNGEPSVVFEIK